jgi:hypothetical protein
MTEEKLTADEYRKLAADSRRRSAESFERCDTDGFVSQFCADRQANLYEVLADLAEAGWVCEFSCLRNTDEEIVPAKLITGRYGPCWALCDEVGQFTGEFVKWDSPKALAKKGLHESKETRPATAKIVASKSARGFSGLASTYVAVVPDDGRRW